MYAFPGLFYAKGNSLVANVCLRNAKQNAQVLIREAILLCLNQGCVCRKAALACHKCLLLFHQLLHLLDEILLYVG